MTTFILDPDDPGRAIIGDATDSIYGAHMGPATLQNIHSLDQCTGRPCVVHAPSRHHMRGWPLTWRGDKGSVERSCPHGIGHPDPDDLAWQVSQGREWAGVHGCDGCCRPGSAT